MTQLDALHHQLADALRDELHYIDELEGTNSEKSNKALDAYDTAKAAPANSICKGCGEWMDPGAPHMCKKAAPADETCIDVVALSRFERLEKERDALKAEYAKLRERIKSLECGGLSQKPFMYGMAYTDGKPVWDDVCVSGNPSDLTEIAESMDANILPLYTGPQVIHMTERAELAEEECAKLLELLRDAIDYPGDPYVRERIDAALAKRDAVDT